MRSEMVGEVDRYNMRRYLSLTANIEGEDLGRVIDRLDAAIVRAGQPPRGTEVELRGQVGPMREMFLSLEIGLSVAVVVILIMLTAYFQEARLAVTAVASVPAVLCGVVLALAVTRSTLNIESFMGAIMAVGVAVSNAIMLVSFADRHRREEGMPADRAAITAAKGRLRPIIMTGCAMIAGMIPMSLGLEKGSEQNAPLGPGRDRGHGTGDGGHAPGPAGRLHPDPQAGLEPISLARSGRPGKRPLRPHRHRARRPAHAEFLPEDEQTGSSGADDEHPAAREPRT